MLRHRSLVMIFSDLLADPEPVIRALRRLRHGGHDVILFHILDEAEVQFPFRGMVEFEEPETSERVQVDADHFRSDYLEEVEEFRETYRRECFQSGIDYVPLDTSMQFDKALLEYLLNRQARSETSADREAGGTAQRNAAGPELSTGEGTMAFVNLSLLFGTLLVGIPIVLHLVMRQKPKQLVFPAIRFLQKRQETNRRTLRLRHWLLLLLRCLAVALVAVALARPSVSSGLFGNWLIMAP